MDGIPIPEAMTGNSLSLICSRIPLYSSDVIYQFGVCKKNSSAMNLALSGSPGINTVSAKSLALASMCGVGMLDIYSSPFFYLDIFLRF